MSRPVLLWGCGLPLMADHVKEEGKEGWSRGEEESKGGGGVDIYKGTKETRRSLQRILSVNVGVCRSERNLLDSENALLSCSRMH